MIRLSVAMLFSFVALAFAADERVKVVTSFLPLYCWTANIAGDLARVDNLLAPQAEPHDYAFSPADARKLAAADLIIVNGAGLETWLPKYLRSAAPGTRGRIIDIAAEMSEALIASGEHHAHPEHGHGNSNPHLWLDPVLAARAVSNISLALQRVDAKNAGTYNRNAAEYGQRLAHLNDEIRTALRDVPRREIVTYHDAFAYFARRYDLRVVGVVERTPDVNPSPKYLAKLSRTIRERGIREIFVSPNSAPRLATQIARDLKVQLVPLDTLEAGPLSADAYEERMRANARTLQERLK